VYILAMAEERLGPDSDRLRRERDLYLRLLQLAEKPDLDALVEEALGLIVEVTGALHGYLELRREADGGEERRWSMARGLSAGEVERVRHVISRGIIAQAIASGETVITASAFLDPRFRQLASVKGGRIEAVLCAPIGEDPPLGVLYLQGRAEAGQFAAEDGALAELFARHLAPAAARLLERDHRREDADPPAAARRALRVEGVIGHGAALGAVLRQVVSVAPLDVSVLLTGETGTGKTQIARVIHDNSPRSAGPVVDLNCAALPEALVESELFGALPGAHSTATRRIEGKVAAAERGTLVLDEVGDLPLATQAKLLQLLQSRQYYPLGGSRPVQADVRVIAATNVDLEAAVKERRFREDLYYRLHVVPIRVPALAERREDVPELAAHFCATAAERHRLPRVRLSPDAVRAAQAAEWPGNVRQLEHAIEAAVIRAAGEGSRQVERAHLFPEASGAPGAAGPLTLQEATRRFQSRVVHEALEESGCNVVEAARRLDVARSQLYKLIHAFGLGRRKR
jgi:Nif-specific regulatory protein